MIKIALIYPNNSKPDYKPNKLYEPSGLLGIYNILREKNECLFIDAIKSGYSSSEVVKVLKKFNPQYLLLSVYEVDEIIEFDLCIIEEMRRHNSEIVVILGGPGAIHSYVKMIGLLNPDYLIKGEGELYFKEFLEKYDLDCMDFELLNKTKIVSPPVMLDMDTINNWERDYSLKEYDYMAMPNIQRGCAGQCIYCTGCGYTKIRYKSSKYAVDEIEYLIQKHSVRHIMPLGPDFTVMPDKALGIIRELNRRNIINLKYTFVVRLDSLFKSINLDTNEWIVFFNNNDVTLQIGIESFNANKLIRLGKYNKNSKLAYGQYEMVKELLNEYNILMNAYFILIDPLSTKKEIMGDINTIIKLLRTYPTKFVVTGKIINYLELYSDTKAFAFFENKNSDAYIKKLIEDADIINESSLYSKRLLEKPEDYKERANEQINILKYFKTYL